MAKQKLTPRIDDIDVANPPAQQQPAPKAGGKAKSQKAKSDRPNIFKRIAKVFREMISELKKVDWPPFKKTKTSPGVWSNTATVLVVVLFFLIIITAFDSGLSALLRLLTNVQ
ncbi:MAG TPA: preprotein translocase subunit SecE [Candidatus Stercoripulliclostridium merdipullorum]|uniref:Preprotein translocase subunit SecE n=1 Tax=Candidatus Stercoripulliclostridium merdipullorum TaxID=2840952 RepID=A0A9D1NCN0_9FIRM|nr:preprotein translocase subunit SecE [Candidatus Stercoripulliclostridium merdipullorum]